MFLKKAKTLRFFTRISEENKFEFDRFLSK